MSQLQREIIAALDVAPEFDAGHEIERRVGFLADYLRESGARGYVLGISGGVDSSTAGRLAQLAVERVRAEGAEATFVAVRLPHGTQQDEDEAQRALGFVTADRVLTHDIKPATDACVRSALEAGLEFTDADSLDFARGNVKARQRMVAQYLIAGAQGMLVIGTDHAAEAVVGFFTKFGDGAADVLPLSGLTKRRVRAVAAALGAPADLVSKVPTADLEDNRPQRPDELALGVSYAAIDEYLEGGSVPESEREVIEGWYRRTAHKRALPVTPADRN